MFTNYWAKTDVYTSQHKDPFRTPAVLNPNHTLIADLRGARFPDGIPNASSDLARNGAVELGIQQHQRPRRGHHPRAVGSGAKISIASDCRESLTEFRDLGVGPAKRTEVQ